MFAETGVAGGAQGSSQFNVITTNSAALVVQSEGNSRIRREIHAEIAGLLNEWDGKGNLCVTSLSLVISGREQHEATNGTGT